jgi:hypothetical protein
MKYALIVFVIFIVSMIFGSCAKELSLENGKPAEPILPEKEISRKYQLRAFYSDIPIDFVENDDEIKSETNLWPYVYDYIRDDINEFFNDSTLVLIHQNDIRIPGIDDNVLEKYYSIGTDSEGAYMKFLGPEYETLRYRLQEINEDYFIIFLKWKHGATIYSRFERVR